MIFFKTSVQFWGWINLLYNL